MRGVSNPVPPTQMTTWGHGEDRAARQAEYMMARLRESVEHLHFLGTVLQECARQQAEASRLLAKIAGET